MKYLLFTDLHLGLYQSSDQWHEISMQFIRHIGYYCYNNKIENIIFLGDFFDVRKHINTKTLNLALKIGKILNHFNTYLIVGNHDCYFKNQINPHSLSIFEKFKNIKVIDEITILDDIMLVPWGMSPQGTQGVRYCFGHFAINGFHMNDSYKCKDGLDKVKFKDFEKVLSGHFHTPSNHHNITYLGAPYGQTFNDTDGIRGYYIFEDGELSFIQYNDAPKFVKIYTESTHTEEDIKGNIVKIIFNKDYGITKNQEIIDGILELKPFLYSVNFTNMENEIQDEYTEDIEMDSKEQIADQYIDKQQFASNINVATLKSMFRKLMKESGEGKSKIRSASGTKIECISIGFQNFLSFGSRWQEISLIDGVNFVTGYDKDKNKSNGCGKSSFLESIAFASFGKTARDIKQSQIVNWKNKKNCKVVFKFKINDDVYEIDRRLKPNKLEIYKNGEMIGQDAHKSDYQSMFEDIFGMDVKMFMSLIHSNINSSSNILSMKKDEKRRFLERMFGLVIYSDMNKLCNEKLRDIEQRKYKIEIDISAAGNAIDSAMKMKAEFESEIKDKENSVEKVDDIKIQLDKLKKDYPDIDSKIELVFNNIKIKKDDFNVIKIEHEKFITEKDIVMTQIEEEIRAINDVEEQRERNGEIQNTINKIIEKTGDIDKIIIGIEENEKNLKNYQNELHKNSKLILKLDRELTELNVDLRNNQKAFDLLSDGKCPTCGQDVKDHVSTHKKDISSIKRKINTREKKMVEYKDIEKKYKENIDCYTKNIKVLHTTKDRLNELRGKIKEVGSEKKKDELIKERDLSLELKQNHVYKFVSDSEEYNDELEKLEEEIKDLNTQRELIRNKEKQYDIAVSKYNEVKKHIESLKKMIKDQEQKAKKISESIVESEEKKKKLNDITDYINAIKFILKDENIKQFTIKQIMPFLNRQVNSYLSEVDYGFYVNIDKWLDVDIKGPGIRNASYGSLSSGEKKGVDLAIQLSLLDISRNQAGIFPDILIFDELLDSSIDSIGMSQLMKIIKSKQKEFGGKIFIISHRSEINAELIDNEYKVVKENSFSKVII